MTPEQELELFDKVVEAAAVERDKKSAEEEALFLQRVESIKRGQEKACHDAAVASYKNLCSIKAAFEKEESAAYDKLSSEAMILWRRRLDEQKLSG